MSSKIYFQSATQKNFRRSMVSTVTGLHHMVAPKHAKGMAKRVFLTPAKPKRKLDYPKAITQHSLKTSEGAIAVYTMGEGPTIVLSHGWSGTASQFFPLMEKIVESGFKAVAFDHVGHGQSEGKLASLPAFIHATEAVIDDCNQAEKGSAVVGIASHSMGTVSTLESRHAGALSVPLLLVAPSLNYTQDMMTTVSRSGYSMKLFKAVIDELSDHYGLPFEAIDPIGKLEVRTPKTFIIHDEADKYAKYEHSKKASAFEGVTLTTTQQCGHGRILKSKEIMTVCDEWLAVCRGQNQ